MNKWFFMVTLLFFLLGAGFVFLQSEGRKVVSSENTPTPASLSAEKTVQTPTPFPVPDEYRLRGGTFAGQTFNNCGPASLSMALSYQGRAVSQGDLAERLRPFNNPLGGVDDKAVFAHELVEEARNHDLESIERPNGTIPMLQALLSQDVSIIIRTWLNPSEDIGHYRVLTGYNKNTGQIYMDDSYNGPNLSMSDEEFIRIWKPFNYGYILVYPEEKKANVEAILGENMNEQISWENARERAERELSKDPNDPYALFNKAIALYYLGQPDKTIQLYEQASEDLPGRMLWYQPEPIEAYFETNEYATALSHIDAILEGGNIAFSELHYIKGRIYEEQGNIEMARNSYQNAVEYNVYYEEAREALEALS